MIVIIVPGEPAPENVIVSSWLSVTVYVKQFPSPITNDMAPAVDDKALHVEANMTSPSLLGIVTVRSAVGSVSETVVSNPSAVAPSRTRPFETAQTEFAASMLFVVSVDPTNAAFTAKFGTVHVASAVASAGERVISNPSAVTPSRTRPFETAQTEFAASMLFVVSVDPTNAAFTAKFGTVHVASAVGSVSVSVTSNVSAVAPSNSNPLATPLIELAAS